MKKDLEELARLFCPDGIVPVPEERSHTEYVSVAYQFLVDSTQYCILRKNIRAEFSDLKPEGVAVRHDLNLPASYVPYLSLPVIDAPDNGHLLQPFGSDIVDVHILNVGNGFYGREIKDGVRVTGVEYVKTSYTGERGVMKLLVVGIYRKEEQPHTTDATLLTPVSTLPTPDFLPTDLPPPTTQ